MGELWLVGGVFWVFVVVGVVFDVVVLNVGVVSVDGLV